MAKTSMFVYNVILFVFLFLVLTFGESKLILNFFVYVINNILLILIIFLYSYFTLQKNIILTPKFSPLLIQEKKNVFVTKIVMHYIRILLVEQWCASMVSVKIYCKKFNISLLYPCIFFPHYNVVNSSLKVIKLQCRNSNDSC
jgi:hypothetical protein